MATLLDEFVIGAAGGTFAGITVWLAQYVHDRAITRLESVRVYRWLKENTSDEPGNQFRTTRAIASWNNLTKDRVRFICSVDKRIFLSTGEKEEVWGVYRHEDQSVYEKHGIRTV